MGFEERLRETCYRFGPLLATNPTQYCLDAFPRIAAQWCSSGADLTW